MSARARLDAWLDRRGAETLLFLLLMGPIVPALVLAAILGAIAGPNAAQVPLMLWVLWVIFMVAAL